MRIPTKEKLVDDAGVDVMPKQMPGQPCGRIVTRALVYAIGDDIAPVLWRSGSGAAVIRNEADEPRWRISYGVAAINRPCIASAAWVNARRR